MILLVQVLPFHHAILNTTWPILAVHCNTIYIFLTTHRFATDVRDTVTIQHCMFITNGAEKNGAAFNIQGTERAIINNCTFIGNGL